MAGIWIDDRYKLKRKIREGAIATVLLCIDDEKNADDDEVIIKQYRQLEGGDNCLQKMVFNREVESLEMTHHKNIVSILDKGFDEASNSYYVVLEYIRGLTLKESREKVNLYSYEEKIEFSLQIIEGIEYLHKHNIVHRDIKPSNIMIDKNGIVKIVDFGTSRLEDTFYSDYTLAGYGTKKYSSPEQLSGKTVSYKSDIYSLGLVLTEIFTGKEVTKYGRDDIETLEPELQLVLEKMTNNDPDLRYTTISEVKCAFVHLQLLNSQGKSVRLTLTKGVATRLFSQGYISTEEISAAYQLLFREYAGKCYIRSNYDQQNKQFDGSFSLFGQQFVSRIVPDQKDNRHFVVVGIRFVDAQFLAMQKEASYEIPYTVKPMAGIYWEFSPNDVDANELVEEVMAFEDIATTKKQVEMEEKNIANRWKSILDIQRQKLESEKQTIHYKNLMIHPDENYLSVEIYDADAENIGQYSADDVLQMTAKSNMYKQIDVGYLRSCANGKMIIDFIRQVDLDNIADNGEISISQRMAEIALQRQNKALKAIQYKENVNPEIANIIMKPSVATSKSNMIFTKEDCYSPLIDESKLRSLEKALAADNLFLLQGPPGTGKTTFISELVHQIIKGNSRYKGRPDSKILIASQSHVAVDHSLAKIREAMPELKMIRIGMQEKMSELSRNFTLDAYCRNWTEEVIQKCKDALQAYKKKIGLNPELQEKHSIIVEIEGIKQELEKLHPQLDYINSELKKIDVIESKWKYVNERIDSIKQQISSKTKGVDDDGLTRIIDAFIENITDVNNKIGSVLESSVATAEQRLELKSKKRTIEKRINDDKQDIAEWRSCLGVDSENEYEELKNTISTRLQEKERQYTLYTKVEKMCTEWQKRVAQGDGLLQESLADSTLVGATCLGIASLSDTTNFVFDWVIIDEAGKATPSEIMVPMSLGKKVILVGDHKQLPPVVDQALLQYNDAKRMNLTRKDLETSLFEYLERGLSSECKGILNEQYRMNPAIGDLISNVFYDDKLTSKTKKEDTTIPLKIYDSKPLVWLNTDKNINCKEERIGGNTYRNTFETHVIFEQLMAINKELAVLGLKKETAIIAGYSAQRDGLQKLYDSRYSSLLTNMTVEINTVDAFQGRETDIVFYSIVRSNEKGNLGFLSDVRRLNVAFSRARQLLVVVGDRRCTQKKSMFFGMPNPFIAIATYFISHPNDCIVKDV